MSALPHSELPGTHHASAVWRLRADVEGRCAAVQALLPRSSSAEWAAAPMEAIRLIDYEYAGLNAVAYDIANHWYAAVRAPSLQVSMATFNGVRLLMKARRISVSSCRPCHMARCEYAADYGTATPHVLDYSRLPGPAERVRYTACRRRAANASLPYRDGPAVVTHPQRSSLAVYCCSSVHAQTSAEH